MALTTTKGEDLVQIITDDCEFNPKFDEITTSWGFKDLGFDYKILSVLGSQSSGKSTLLNHLFNTGFAVLDATSGIHQTTLGIWASPGDTKSILVLDVEGTDSKERGEENTAFEKKTSLFSLALSEILIINVNAKDIGCLKASNFSLLKFVLELNLQLFQRNKTSKTLLLFTVRDWCDDTPQEVIKKQLGGDMKIIWGEISKPSEFASSPMSQFFDVDFQLFSHYKYEKSKFLDQTRTLREKLTNPDHPEYLWNSEYITDVPSDGFDCYAKNIWEVVKENRDLDLPSQKAMLALFRCGEISEQIYIDFVESIKPMRQKVKNNDLPVDFGSSLSTIVEQSMESYNEPSSRYHKETADAKGKELLEKMKKELFAVYLEYLGKLRGQIVSEFDKKVENVIPDNENEILANFATVMEDLRSNSLESFETRSKDAAIAQAEGEWSAENDLEELTDTLNKRIAVARENQLRRMVDKLEKNIKVKIVEPLQDVLEQPAPDMWENIRAIEVKGKGITVNMLEKELSSFACSEADISKKVGELQRRVRVTMEETIKKHVDNLYDNIMKIFTKKFHYDEGLPRKWNKDVNVEEIYVNTKEEVLNLVDLFSINRLDAENDEFTHESEEDIPTELILLSKREAAQLKTRFLQTSDAMFSTARSEQERNSAVTQIPGFMFILLLIFAFDEILWILSNPLLFMLSAVIFGIGALLWYLDLLHIVRPIFSQVIRQATSSANNLIGHAHAAVPTKEKDE